MDLHVLPMPKTAGADALMTQAGVGLCAYKTTEQKAEAAALFVRWLTEAERNLDFIAQTGYMPVRNGAFDSIESYGSFPEPAESYQSLYAALKTMREDYVPVSEPRFEGYDKFLNGYAKLSTKELEICEALVSGLSTRQSAEQIGCASSTVDTYRKRVYEKTGIHRVRQLQLCVALMRMEQQESEPQKES